jgi:hypothetical protein
MKISEVITEGLSHPIICVDVQPEYNGYDGEANPKFVQIMQFVQKQTGPVLFFVNAEDQGLSGDTVQSIQHFWDNTLGTPGEDYVDDNDEYVYKEAESPIDWRRFTIIDKGFGYLRAWMDQGVDPRAIIKTIRLMYQEKVSDSRDLFGGSDSDEYEEGMKQLLGPDYLIGLGDPLSVGWTSVAQLKRFSGAYLVGGGRDECLREVELLMNAFNIKYRRIDSLVY